MRVTESFLDELVSRNDIVDVVSEYVPLTKRGGDYWGLCPFHSEKTASFHVSPGKQIYKCFGCGKGGGVINFVMEEENLPFMDAVRLLAKRAGMEMPETGEQPGVRERRQRLLALNREAARYFHRVLNEPQGAEGMAYLQQRGLSRRTITRFGLGMAPDGWTGLVTAMTDAGYSKADLLETGLAVASEKGRIHDRFRNRVIFPILDLRGEVIGFGGRVLDDGSPKYLNSPDSIVFSKGRNLFALNLAHRSRQGRLILTEGYMDTITLHQAGFDCAVASLGTALTQDHARLMARYVPEVILCYDGDDAGISAAQRAIPILGSAGLRVRVLRMTGAKDPDEYIRRYGTEAFAKLLDQSEGQVEYRLARIQERYRLDDDAQRLEFMREAVQLLAALPGALEREVYGARVAQTAGVSADAIAEEVKKQRNSILARQQRKQERQDLTPAAQRQPKERELRYHDIRSARAEEGVVRLVLAEPALFEKLEGRLEPEQFSSPVLGRVYGLLRDRWKRGLQVSLATLAGELTGDEMSLVTRISDEPVSLANGEQALEDCVRKIHSELARREVQSDEDLRAAQRLYKEAKGYGGE